MGGSLYEVEYDEFHDTLSKFKFINYFFVKF